MKILILAGGGGTRLWPLSRQSWPKQFLNLSGNPQGDSLLVETIRRCLCEDIRPSDIYIVTGTSLLPQVHHELQKADLPEILSNVICEPCRRNTAPAIALAAQFIKETAENSLSEAEVIAVLPADHAMLNDTLFQEDLQAAAQLALEGYIVTLGITPTRPETGFGYIETDSSVSGKGWAPVARFIEKPDHATACRYLESGRYLWNAGIFVMTLGTMMQSFKQHAPKIYQVLEPGYTHAFEQFQEMPNISIDYAIMEHAAKMAVMPLRSPWSDLGSWDNVYDKFEKDATGNALYGTQGQLMNTTGSLVWSETGRFVGTIGLEDYLVVDTPDALLIAKRGDSQSVRDIIEALDQAATAKEEISALTQALPYQREVWGELHALGIAQNQAKPDVVSYQLILKPNQVLELSTENPTRWCVVSGRGHWQDLQQVYTVEALASWVQKPSSTGLLRVEDQPLVLLCVGDKPEIYKPAENLPESVFTLNPILETPEIGVF